MASQRIGYAVVGLGGIARRAVLPAFANSRKSRLVALVSGTREKASELAAKYGASDVYTYEEYDECLANPHVDAVFLASPNGCHADQAIRAAQSRTHVLCEKPMANTVDECWRMVEACRANNVRLMIAYRKYFEPAGVALKKLVSDGKLGPLRVIHTAFTIMLPVEKVQPWRFDPKLAGGGALPDVGVYCVNTGRWIAGCDPVEASASSWTVDARHFGNGIDENMAFELKFPGGLILQGTASFRAAKASFLHVHGEKGWAALDPAYAYDDERRFFGKAGGRWFHKVFPLIDEFALELDALADSIRSGKDPEPDGIQGLRDVAVMEAIYTAAREHRSVPIPPE